MFAKYDGNYVSELDAHLRSEYYTVPANNRGVEFTSSIGIDEAEKVSENEIKTSGAGAVATVEETLAGVYETDYFSSMTDIDAFLK